MARSRGQYALRRGEAARRVWSAILCSALRRSDAADSTADDPLRDAVTHSWRPPLLLLALLSCTGARQPAPPPHEFLVAAGDSTFWVQKQPSGIHVRGSPILLVRLDGRFHELYVADDDRSYFDAIFVGQRMYRRDLISGDSLLIHEDSLIPALARAWARRNPGAEPLPPDEEASADPETYAAAELEIVDLHGPFLSYEYHLDVETRDGEESHVTRWGVLDVRVGRSVTLASLFGEADAKRIEAEGRKRFGALVDSMLAIPGEEGRLAAEALTGFAFDPRSFTLVQLHGESAVAYLVSGQGPTAEGLTLELEPIAAGAPDWWLRLGATLPVLTDEPTVERWRGPGYEVLARYGTEGDTAVLALASAGTEWRVATLPAPILRIEWLDSPPIDSVSRRALSRAFDEASLYDETTRIVRADERESAPVLLAAASRQRAQLPHGHR